MEGAGDRKALLDDDKQMLDTSVVPPPDVNSPLNEANENVSVEVSSPKPRISVSLPQSKYPPITRIDPPSDPVESPTFRTFEESPLGSESPNPDDREYIFVHPSLPAKPVDESPSTNIIPPSYSFPTMTGVPDLISFGGVMDSPKSIFTDSESSTPSPLIRNGQVHSLTVPCISPNPPKLERKDSRESWTLYTPSELRMSPLGAATPQSQSFLTPPISSTTPRHFWAVTHHHSAPTFSATSQTTPPSSSPKGPSTPTTPTPFFCESDSLETATRLSASPVPNIMTETPINPTRPMILQDTRSTLEFPYLSAPDLFPISSPTVSPRNSLSTELNTSSLNTSNSGCRTCSPSKGRSPSKETLSSFSPGKEKLCLVPEDSISSQAPLLASSSDKTVCCSCLIA